jgi:putative transposase
VKRTRFSEEQIIAILREAEAAAKVTELCRRHGILDATFYTWRSKYGVLEISEMRRLRQLEEENRRLKAIVADQALDIRALKELGPRAHCLASGPNPGRRSAMRSSLGSGTRQFFGHPQERVNGGRKSL